MAADDRAAWRRAASAGSAAAWPAMLLVPPLLVWTLPQTLAGLVFAAWRRLQGHRLEAYRFGPFLYLVVPAPGPLSPGISLGLVIFASTPDLLKHEFCHLVTALWLSWLYLPVYGLEYLIIGHDRSPHERLTCRFERTIPWSWHRLHRRRGEESPGPTERR